MRLEEIMGKMSVFVKHTTPAERMQRVIALAGQFEYYYETDFTAFEASFTPVIQDVCENALFSHVFRNHPDVCKLQRAVNSGTCSLRSRSGVSAKLDGRRKSGDPWTSCFNGFSNYCLVTYFAEKQGSRMDGIFEGDDGLFGMSEPFAGDFTVLGFDVKMKRVPDPRLAAFCGLTFGDSEQVIRDPVRFLQKFGWTSSHLLGPHKVMLELLRAKALSALHETPHCPIIAVVAREALIRTRSSNPLFVNDGYHDFSRVNRDEQTLPPFAPSASTRLLFAETYGIPVETQLLIENMATSGRMDEISGLMVIDPEVSRSEYTHVW